MGDVGKTRGAHVSMKPRTPSPIAARVRLARIALAVATAGETGLSRDDLQDDKTIHGAYGGSDEAVRQALRRDLLALTAASPDGALVERDQLTKRYRVRAPIRPLRLSSVALMTLAALLSALADGSLPGADEFAERIRGALAADQLPLLERLLIAERRTNGAGPAGQVQGASASISLALDLPRLSDADRATVTTLLDAQQRRQLVTFAYRSPRDGQKEHFGDQIEEIRFGDRHCFVEAWCEDAQRYLEFRLDRIIPNSVRIEPQRARDRGRRRGVEVRYWLSAVVARDGEVTERLAGQLVTPARDGVIISGRARDLFAARRLLLGYGEYARALEPPQLVAAMRASVSEMTNFYMRPADKFSADATSEEEQIP